MKDDAITARADQDVVVVDSGKHMFENYGELDNSLYFETHGVVPDDNTFHCASIDGGRYFWLRCERRGWWMVSEQPLTRSE